MRRYLALAAWMLAAFLALVAGFNAWIDPYRIWHLPWGYSETYPRPRATQQLALLKERGVAATLPVSLVLGNSRAEIGFNPDSPQWPADWRPVFNAAIPGTGIESALQALSRSIKYDAAIRTALVGLEFSDFLVDRDVPPIEAPTGHVAVPQSWLSRLVVDAKIAVSLDTLFDAIITVMKRADLQSADITRYGFNPLREYETSVAQEGYGAIFLQRDTENAGAYVRFPKHIYIGDSKTSASIEALEQLIALARSHNVKVKFVIYPYHAHILLMLQEAGLMPAFAAWKKRLVELVGSDEAGDNRRCALWDFSGYHAHARESVPELGDKSSIVASYWESGHFKHELGDRMLAQIFDHPDDGFGVCLTAANVDQQIAALSRGEERYVKERPAESAQITYLIRNQVAAKATRR